MFLKIFVYTWINELVTKAFFSLQLGVAFMFAANVRYDENHEKNKSKQNNGK